MQVPIIMGILNITPDSFSDGGLFFDHSRAIDRGLCMLKEGATVVDVGGESTRPGAKPVPLEVELERVIPVVRELATFATVSIDTKKPEVARMAVEAGATVINDISASLAPVAAEYGVTWVAMHMKGEPTTMQVDPHYDDVAGEVRDFLSRAVEGALALGVKEIWIDPGIGFGKTAEHNLTLLRSIPQFESLGLPVMVGLSRKRFLADLSRSGVTASEPAARLGQSVAGALLSVLLGASVVRVHDVAATKAVVDALLACQDGYYDTSAA